MKRKRILEFNVKLTADLWQHILKFCTPLERSRCAYAAVPGSDTIIISNTTTSVDLSAVKCQGVIKLFCFGEATLKTLLLGFSYFENIRSLSLYEIDGDDAVCLLEKIEFLRKLHSLTVEHLHTTDASNSYEITSTSLKELRISDCSVDFVLLLPNLESLNVHRALTQLAPIKDLKRLKKLKIHRQNYPHDYFFHCYSLTLLHTLFLDLNTAQRDLLLYVLQGSFGFEVAISVPSLKILLINAKANTPKSVHLDVLLKLFPNLEVLVLLVRRTKFTTAGTSAPNKLKCLFLDPNSSFDTTQADWQLPLSSLEILYCQDLSRGAIVKLGSHIWRGKASVKAWFKSKGLWGVYREMKRFTSFR